MREEDVIEQILKENNDLKAKNSQLLEENTELKVNSL